MASTVRVARARGLDGDLTLCADFSDLDVHTQALLLRLHPIRDLDDFAVLRQVVRRLEPPYSLREVTAAAAADPASARLATRIENLGVADWGLWRRDDETSVIGADLTRCSVLDTGSLATPDERTAVSLVLLGNRWARRRERRPMLIAADEAHNIFPAASSDPLLGATVELGALIAARAASSGCTCSSPVSDRAKCTPTSSRNATT